MTYLLEHYRYVAALVISGIVFFGALGLFNRLPKASDPISNFSLDTTMTEIKSELQRLEDMPGDRLGLVLSEVRIDLVVEEERGVSDEAGFGVPVFDEDALKSSESLSVKGSSTLSVVLVPPKGKAILSGDKTGTIRFADLLAATRESLQRAMQNEPKLDSKSIEVKLNFVLVKSKSRNADIKTKIISAGVAAEEKNSNANTITLTYINPAYQQEKASAKPSPP